MKEGWEIKAPFADHIPLSGHFYTDTEVRMRLAKKMNDMRQVFGSSGFSGTSGYPGVSGFSGSVNIRRRAQDGCINPHVVNETSSNDSSESFIAKGIRELKEYFQSLFMKTPKKEIEHGE